MAETLNTPQQVREQFKVAETYYHNTFRLFNDVTQMTTDYAFDAFEKGRLFAHELNNQFDKNMQVALGSYRAIYLNSLRSWQGYLQGLTDAVVRTTR
jgi:hypothetical protein